MKGIFASGPQGRGLSRILKFMLRWKNTVGRVALELLFGDLVEWEGNVGRTDLTALARRTNLRPCRLVEYLEEMKTLGYLSRLDIHYKTIIFKFKTTKWSEKKTDATGWRR